MKGRSVLALLCVCVCVCVCATPKEFKTCSDCEVRVAEAQLLLISRQRSYTFQVQAPRWQV